MRIRASSSVSGGSFAFPNLGIPRFPMLWKEHPHPHPHSPPQCLSVPKTRDLKSFHWWGQWKPMFITSPFYVILTHHTLLPQLSFNLCLSRKHHQSSPWSPCLSSLAARAGTGQVQGQCPAVHFSAPAVPLSTHRVWVLPMTAPLLLLRV